MNVHRLASPRRRAVGNRRKRRQRSETEIPPLFANLRFLGCPYCWKRGGLHYDGLIGGVATPTFIQFAAWLAILASGAVFAADEQAAQKLADVDAKITAQPDDPLLHYQRAQLLARLEKYDEAYAAAQVAMGKFTAAKKDLAWLMLDSFEAGGRKVTVHFNMGPHERARRKRASCGPSRSASLRRTASRSTKPLTSRSATFGGQRLTAAFGQTTDEGHANLGPAKPDLPYSKIRPAAMELIGKRVRPE